MAAPTNAANVKKALANSEPSTHGTSRTSQDVRLELAKWGKADLDQVGHQSQFYEYTSLMLGSARQLRLRPAAMAFALGETIELQDDADVVGQ